MNKTLTWNCVKCFFLLFYLNHKTNLTREATVAFIFMLHDLHHLHELHLSLHLEVNLKTMPWCCFGFSVVEQPQIKNWTKQLYQYEKVWSECYRTREKNRLRKETKEMSQRKKRLILKKKQKLKFFWSFLHFFLDVVELNQRKRFIHKLRSLWKRLYLASNVLWKFKSTDQKQTFGNVRTIFLGGGGNLFSETRMLDFL